MGEKRRPRPLVVEVVSPRGIVARGVGPWLESVAPGNARGTLIVAITSDERVRELNRRYRGANAATDVLSFPSDARGRPRHGGRPELGEVVIAAGVARRQADAAGHGLQTEFRVLALHGLLHLLGYDHERDNGRMARVERQLRRKGGLRAGLIERVEVP
jgi:probable rRNA maturation factor